MKTITPLTLFSNYLGQYLPKKLICEFEDEEGKDKLEKFQDEMRMALVLIKYKGEENEVCFT